MGGLPRTGTGKTGASPSPMVAGFRGGAAQAARGRPPVALVLTPTRELALQIEGQMEKLSAHITGTVVRIEKKPGDAVSAGDAVVVLESMKMEMPVEATAAGKVREVRCAEGQPVAEGDLLAVIE